VELASNLGPLAGEPLSKKPLERVWGSATQLARHIQKLGKASLLGGGSSGDDGGSAQVCMRACVCMSCQMMEAPLGQRVCESANLCLSKSNDWLSMQVVRGAAVCSQFSVHYAATAHPATALVQLPLLGGLIML